MIISNFVLKILYQFAEGFWTLATVFDDFDFTNQKKFPWLHVFFLDSDVC